MINVSILTIGDEICIGQTIDTNATEIAAECTKIGAEVSAHVAVRDEAEQIKSELKRLIEISDFVLITGGLGPTDDDLTKPVLADFFNDKLEFRPDVLAHIEELYEKRGLKMYERNKKMAELPSKCEALPNEVGVAPGMLFETEGKFVVSMPGVPPEMRSILRDSVLPLIKKKVDSADRVRVYKTLMTYKIYESKAAEALGDTEEILGEATLAFLPSYKGVKLRLGAVAESREKAEKIIKKAEKKIKAKIGEFIVASEDKPLETIVGEKLSASGKTIAVAESCTAGSLGKALTEMPGSSSYFLGGLLTYGNEAKINLLKVNKATIEKYGAVSEQTAYEMATNVREIFGADYGVGITGIAGPAGGTEEKPVGTVWISLADENGCKPIKYVFGEKRDVNRERSVGSALSMIMNKLKNE